MDNIYNLTCNNSGFAHLSFLPGSEIRPDCWGLAASGTVLDSLAYETSSIMDRPSGTIVLIVADRIIMNNIRDSLTAAGGMT